MPMVRAMRLLNAVEAGTLTGANLQTLLAGDAGRMAELNALFGMRGQCRRMAASSTTMTALAASSTAMTALVAASTAMSEVVISNTAMTALAASSTAMTAIAASSTVMAAVAASSTVMAIVAASSTAMSAVAASSTAMSAVAASSTARSAVWGSDTALTAIAASSTAIAAIRAATTFAIVSQTCSTGSVIPVSGINQPRIIVGISEGSEAGTWTLTGRRSGSSYGNLTINTTAVNTNADQIYVLAVGAAVTAQQSSGTTRVIYLATLPV